MYNKANLQFIGLLGITGLATRAPRRAHLGPRFQEGAVKNL